MKFLAPYLLLVFMPLIWAQELSLNATNSDWYSIKDQDSIEYPVAGQWQKFTPDGQFIIPPYKATAGITLLESDIAPKPVPRMLQTAVYSPAGGTIRFGEKDISRYAEFIDEKAYVSDATIEYLLDLEGRWSLDKTYSTDKWLIEFVTGHENWLEIISDNKVIAESKGQIILKGSELPKNGQLQIRASSIQKDNKGLVQIRAFQAYEMMMPDAQHLGFQQLLKSGKTWQAPTSKNIQAIRKKPESTPAAYKRTYQCETKEDTQNVLLNRSENVAFISINGKTVPLNSIVIPPGFLQEGKNEVIYYSKQINSSLHDEFSLTSFKPFFLKTTVSADEKHIIKPMLRGARAIVYINGQFAGTCLPEKNEAFGLGLFQQGENEIALCLLQDSPKTFVEYINIAKASAKTALILPWTQDSTNRNEVKILGPGPRRNASGSLLANNPENLNFSSQFSIKDLPQNDLQLDFNNSSRLPSWQFSNQYSAPFVLFLNGARLQRQGSSFILPKDLIKESNVIKFSSDSLSIPEPILYTEVQATPISEPRLKLKSRSGQPRLHSSTFFTGESLNWQLNFDPITCDTLEISHNGKKEKRTIAEMNHAPLITTHLQEPGTYELKIIARSKSQEVFSFTKSLKVEEYPKNSNGWLRAHGQLFKVELSDQAFFESESNLFPQKFPAEWLRRELISDGDDLQFGALKTWSSKQKFSIYEFLPNGNSVFDKFYNRLYCYLKIKSRGLPSRFIMSRTTQDQQLWTSAIFMLQYLKWLEKEGENIDWQLPTLKAYKKRYLEPMPQKAAAFVSKRKDTINSLIKKMALTAAPGSTFEEFQQ